MPYKGHRYRNQFRTEGDVSYILFFTKAGEQEAEVAIDTQDLERVLEVGKWGFTHGKYARYEGNASTGYKQIALHQFITRSDSNERVRFVNGDTKDCRMANLKVTGRKNPVVCVDFHEARMHLFNKEGNLISETKIDVEDIDRITSWGRWGEDDKGYVTGEGWSPNRGKMKLHRLVFNAPEGTIVDHINGDVKDNRKCNLRLVTHSQNLQNTKMSARNKTGVRNVHFIKTTGKYGVSVYANGKQNYFGTYDTVEEAAEVAEVKRSELHTHARA